MTITREEAEGALKEIKSADSKSRELFGYRLSSRYFLLWGAIWIVGTALVAISPENTGLIWFVINAVGLAVSVYFSFTGSEGSDPAGRKTFGIRYLMTAVVMTGFFCCSLLIFTPITGVQIYSFITLFMASLYMTVGVWWGSRYAVLGGLLAVLSLAAFYAAPGFVPLVSTGLGGCALILTGLWMRAA